MERPVYHIKGVVKDRTEIPGDFVGPLDLILHLLRKNKLAIRDIPLALILEQCLDWGAARQRMDLEVAGEFITMASHLMLIKTRMLLSEEVEEAQSEMEALIASLEEKARRENQRRILEILPQMEAAYQTGRGSFPKGPEPLFARRVYRYEHQGRDLIQAMEAWRKRQGRAIPPTLGEFRGVVRPEPYRVERKAEQLLELLEKEGPLSLGQMVARAESRSEATAVFLALLELCRGGRVHLAGTMEDPKVTIRRDPREENPED